LSAQPGGWRIDPYERVLVGVEMSGVVIELSGLEEVG
jgi:hypothetical protein